MRQYFISVRCGTIGKPGNTDFDEGVGKGDLRHDWRKYKCIEAPWNAVWQYIVEVEDMPILPF